VFDWMRTSGRGVAALLALSATVNLCLGFFNVALVAVVVHDRRALGGSAAGGRRGRHARRRHRDRSAGTARTAGAGHHARAVHAGGRVRDQRASPVAGRRGDRCGRFALAAVPLVSTAATTMLHERVPAAMHGRMFALRGGISRALDPIGAVVAGVVISMFAEPAMSAVARCDRTVGRVLATGDGRGAALVMIFVGLALAVIATAARSSASLRHWTDLDRLGTDPQVEA
jgi:hypothetical protein